MRAFVVAPPASLTVAVAPTAASVREILTFHSGTTGQSFRHLDERTALRSRVDSLCPTSRTNRHATFNVTQSGRLRIQRSIARTTEMASTDIPDGRELLIALKRASSS